MKAFLNVITAWLVCSSPVSAQSLSIPHADAVEAVIAKSGFDGDVAASLGGVSVSFMHASLPLEPYPSERADEPLWRWASVTKQVVAVLVMQEVVRGTIKLDVPVSTYLPKFASPNAGKITVRQLLRHQSGLPNPDDAQASSISESAFYFPFYKGSRDPLTGYCAGPPKGEVGGNWSYNNCDYMVAGALLEAVTGKSWQVLVDERIAKPLGLETLSAYPTKRWTRKGLVDGKPEPAFDLSTFGAAAGLYGTAEELIRFDDALMKGKLLPAEALKEMWDGQANLGFIALGQWVFEASLKGCAAPTRIVERRGAIGGVQVRNFMAPDRKVAVAAFVQNDKFDFGEIWQGKGFSFDLLSAALCPEKEK